MRYYDTLLQEQRGPFTVIVDKTYEDLSLADCFDDSCYDIQEMNDKVNRGDLDWFMLRTRVMFEGVELASEYLGGMLYEDARECLKDGMAEDQIEQALYNARKEVLALKDKFNRLDLTEAA